jgi:hypothetical protein
MEIEEKIFLTDEETVGGSGAEKEGEKEVVFASKKKPVFISDPLTTRMQKAASRGNLLRRKGGRE